MRSSKLMSLIKLDLKDGIFKVCGFKVGGLAFTAGPFRFLKDFEGILMDTVAPHARGCASHARAVTINNITFFKHMFKNYIYIYILIRARSI